MYGWIRVGAFVQIQYEGESKNETIWLKKLPSGAVHPARFEPRVDLSYAHGTATIKTTRQA